MVRISHHQFEGNFHPQHANKPGELKVTKLPENQGMIVDIILEPDGEFFLPDEVVFKETIN